MPTNINKFYRMYRVAVPDPKEFIADYYNYPYNYDLKADGVTIGTGTIDEHNGGQQLSMPYNGTIDLTSSNPNWAPLDVKLNGHIIGTTPFTVAYADLGLQPYSDYLECCNNYKKVTLQWNGMDYNFVYNNDNGQSTTITVTSSTAPATVWVNLYNNYQVYFHDNTGVRNAYVTLNGTESLENMPYQIDMSTAQDETTISFRDYTVQLELQYMNAEYTYEVTNGLGNMVYSGTVDDSSSGIITLQIRDDYTLTFDSTLQGLKCYESWGYDYQPAQPVQMPFNIFSVDMDDLFQNNGGYMYFEQQIVEVTFNGNDCTFDYSITDSDGAVIDSGTVFEYGYDGPCYMEYGWTLEIQMHQSTDGFDINGNGQCDWPHPDNVYTLTYSDLLNIDQTGQISINGMKDMCL